jgi:transcription antitermination factor NusG
VFKIEKASNKRGIKMGEEVILRAGEVEDREEESRPVTADHKVAEDNIFVVGDTIRLRSGAYAGKTGTLMRVYPYNKDQGPSDALVMVRLVTGGNNSCYMSNLERIEEAPD